MKNSKDVVNNTIEVINSYLNKCYQLVAELRRLQSENNQVDNRRDLLTKDYDDDGYYK